MANRLALSDNAQRALPYWSAIMGAAASHSTTAQLWAAIRAASETWGNIGKGPTLRGVSELRGIANSIIRASDQIMGLPESKRLLGAQVVRAPWARSPGQQRVSPMYQVRFLHTFTQGGETVQQWRTTSFEGRLPRTIGDLRQLVESDAESLADDYDVQHLDASNIQLLSV